jgi:hypothetical protein
VGEERKSAILLEGSEASPTRPSTGSCELKVKTCLERVA